MAKKNKQKTKKSVLKRFKITKKTKILHRAHGSRHLKSAKTKRRLRSQKIPKKVVGRYVRKIRMMIGK